MSEKTRYFKIGLFAVGAIGLLCAGLVLFGAGRIFEKPPAILETYFDHSIQGLDVGSPVKFRGVKVGEVREILFLKDEYKDTTASPEGVSDKFTFIIVRFAVKTKHFQNLIDGNQQEIQEEINHLVERNGLRVKLNAIGITGLVYLEIDFLNPKENPIPKIEWKPKHLYIPSAPSTFSVIRDSIGRLALELDKNVYPMLENLRQSSKNFPEIATKLNNVLTQAEATSRNLEEITATAKKYPAQLIFGQAPQKSRFDR